MATVTADTRPIGGSFLRTLRREGLCVRECLRFGLRHPRYLLVFGAVYGRALTDWQKSRPARMGYAFLQLFDDYMDGDRACSEDLDSLAERIKTHWQAGLLAEAGVLDCLGASFYESLQRLPASEADVATADVTELLAAMHDDAKRRMQRLRLSELALQVHMFRTFHASLNLLLRCAGCRTTANEVPAVVAALSWCSVVRDFTEDVGKGLINIPAESIPPEVVDAEILAHPQVQAWLLAERRRGGALIEQSEVQIKAVAAHDPPAAKLLAGFTRSMRKYQ